MSLTDLEYGSSFTQVICQINCVVILGLFFSTKLLSWEDRIGRKQLNAYARPFPGDWKKPLPSSGGT